MRRASRVSMSEDRQQRVGRLGAALSAVARRAQAEGVTRQLAIHDGGSRSAYGLLFRRAACVLSPRLNPSETCHASAHIQGA